MDKGRKKTPMRTIQIAIMFLLRSVMAYRQETTDPELPLSIPTDQIEPLRSPVKKDFQQALEQRLKKNKRNVNRTYA